MDTTLTSRSTNSYNRFFDRPVYLSVVFLCVSGLFAIVEARTVWIFARYWHAIPQEMRLTSIVLAAGIAVPWLMLVRQHRTLKFDGEPSQPQKLTTRGEGRNDYDRVDDQLKLLWDHSRLRCDTGRVAQARG